MKQGGDIGNGVILHPPGLPSRGGVMDIGLKCTHSCVFCYYSHMDGHEDQFRAMRRASFRPLEDCKAVLAGLKANGIVNFDYTGGEPSLHGDIVELTRYASRELGLASRMITLGQFFMRRMKNCRTNRLIDDLLDAGLTSVLFSTHAAEPGLFKRLTGESLEKQAAAMDYLDAKDFSYAANTVICKGNVQHLPTIARYMAERNAYAHNFILPNPYYGFQDGKRVVTGLDVRYSEVYPHLGEAVEILESAGVAVNIRFGPLCALPGLERHLVGFVGVRHDPNEWRNREGGGTLEQNASLAPIEPGGYETETRRIDGKGVLDGCIELSGVRGDNFKVYAAKCASCLARDACDGINPGYLSVNGDEDFTPFEQATQYTPLQTARYGNIASFLVKGDQKAPMRQATSAWLASEKTAPTAPISIAVIASGDAGLEATLADIASQSLKEFEAILIDATGYMDMDPAGEQLASKRPDLLIRTFSPAVEGDVLGLRNTAFGIARGDWISVLEGGDRLDTSYAAKMLEAARRDDGVSFAVSAFRFADDQPGVVRSALSGASVLERPTVHPGAVASKGLWESLGGYWLGMGAASEWCFWIHAHHAGYRGAIVDEALVIRRSSSLIEMMPEQAVENIRAGLLRRHAPQTQAV